MGSQCFFSLLHFKQINCLRAFLKYVPLFICLLYTVKNHYFEKIDLSKHSICKTTVLAEQSQRLCSCNRIVFRRSEGQMAAIITPPLTSDNRAQGRSVVGDNHRLQESWSHHHSSLWHIGPLRSLFLTCTVISVFALSPTYSDPDFFHVFSRVKKRTVIGDDWR